MWWLSELQIITLCNSLLQIDPKELGHHHPILPLPIAFPDVAGFVGHGAVQGERCATGVEYGELR
jgi:hypothetical protein